MKYIQKVKVKLEKFGRINKENRISAPKDIAGIIYEYLEDVDREYLGVICLSTKNYILNIATISIGTLNSSLIHPREVFKTAILSNAASIILFHNHPSGDTSPSKEDINSCMRINEVSKIMGINLLDNIIIGSEIYDGYSSFKEKGII